MQNIKTVHLRSGCDHAFTIGCDHKSGRCTLFPHFRCCVIQFISLLAHERCGIGLLWHLGWYNCVQVALEPLQHLGTCVFPYLEDWTTVLTAGEQSNNCADLACGSTIAKKSHMTPSQTVQTHEDWLVCSVILLDGRQSHHINNSINLSALADETSLVSSNGSQALCGDLSI